VLPQPWCMGFLTGMRLRQQKWNPLLDLSRMDHGLMLPILLYCTDPLGRPMLGPLARGQRPRNPCAPRTTTSPSLFQQSAITGCRSGYLPPKINPEISWLARIGYETARSTLVIGVT
jgi:hypothetical protein